MSRLHLIFKLVALFTLGSASAAWGSTLDVNPVRVHLSPTQRSETLLLRNRSAEAVRYQVQVHAWQQSKAGEMQLSPSRDLIAFPSLLEFKPGEQRRVKVAAVSSAGRLEKTYRIVLEPLPTAAPEQRDRVRLLTRINLPVFLQPAKPRPQQVVGMKLENGMLMVTVANTGSSYFMARSIQLLGRSRTGARTLHMTLPGWYVLAGGQRIYAVPLPKVKCTELESISATLKTKERASRAVLRLRKDSCGS